MQNKLVQFKQDLGSRIKKKIATVEQRMETARKLLLESFYQNWHKLAFMMILIVVGSVKDISIDFNLQSLGHYLVEEEVSDSPIQSEPSKIVPAKLWSWWKKKDTAAKDLEIEQENENLANTYSNLTYTKGKFKTVDNVEAKRIKRKKQEAYIKKYFLIAQEEMKKHGVPASITLAQGLLESNVGESKLALENNNHFGIKCFSRTCMKGHCSNYTDDSHKDFFRIYNTARESFASHTQLLQGPRYSKLFQLKSNDYKGWALGLKKAGYATDKSYGEKLINLIEDLKLHRYDKKW